MARWGRRTGVAMAAAGLVACGAPADPEGSVAEAVGAHLARARTSLDAEGFEQAFAALEAAGALSPHSPRIQRDVQRALLKRAAARPAVITEAATPALLYAVEVFKDDATLAAERLTVEAHLALGRGEAEVALKKLAEAHGVAPAGYPHALLAQAAILRVKGDKLEAIAAYEKAITAAPKSLTALNNTGVAWLEYDRAEDALKLFEQAAAVLDNASTRLNAADASLRLERKVEAEEHLKRAMALAPRSAEPLRRLAKLLRESQRGDEAKAVLQRALSLEVDAWTCFNLATLLQEQGQHVEALPLLSKVLSLDPASHAAAYHIAISAQALGDQAGVEAAVNRYFQLSQNVPGEEGRRKELISLFSKGATPAPASDSAPSDPASAPTTQPAAPPIPAE